MRLKGALESGMLLFIIVCIFLMIRSQSKKTDLKTAIISTFKDWQNVSGSQYKFSVYSAYYLMDQEPQEVFIIAVTKTYSTEQVNCQFYYWDERTSLFQVQSRVKGSIETDDLHWNLKYAGVFIKCPFPSDSKPDIVSVLVGNETVPSNYLPIQYKSENNQIYNHTFSICVFPTFDYNEVFHFLEWVEFYKVMGVEHVTMFNVSIGPNTSCIIDEINKDEDNPIKLTVHPWHKNPMKTWKEIRSGPCVECSLSAASNDCLFKHRGHFSKYMVVVDLDEFIMPREKIADNYTQLIDLLDSKNRDLNIGQYLFKNGFFIRSRPDDPAILERCSSFKDNRVGYRICKESFMMSKVIREEYQPYSSRTKFIVRSEGIRRAGTHFALSYEEGFVSLNVTEDIAFSRHYRMFNESDKNYVDRIPLEFGMKLVERVSEKVEYYMDKCGLSFSDVFK